MNRNVLSIVLTGLLALTGVAAHAENPDPSGQFAITLPGSTANRAAVTADFQAHRQETAAMTREDSGSAYIASRFQGAKSREQVRAEYLASRDQVKAMTGEDSGSAYLAAHKPLDAQRQFAGQPTKGE